MVNKETKRDTHTGLVNPPIYPCYQDDGKLCKLRAVEGSNMKCIYDITKGCPHSKVKK